jgi:hypothetical protein
MSPSSRIRRPAAVRRFLALGNLAAALAAALLTAACGLGALDDPEAAVEISWVSGWGYYASGYHDLNLDALVSNLGDGTARVEQWSFRLQRSGTVIATIDSGNAGQYGLGFEDLDTYLGTGMDSTGRVTLDISGMQAGRPFYATSPPDTVVFRCTVLMEGGERVELEESGAFQHSEG